MDDAAAQVRPAGIEAAALLSLHRLITKVHAVQDLGEVLSAIAEGVVETLGFQVAVIDRIDPFGYMEAVAVAGHEEARRSMLQRRTPARAFFDEMEAADHWGLLRFMPHDRLPPDASYSYVPDMVPSDEPDAWHPLDALYVPLPGPTGGLIGVLSVDEPADGRRPDVLSRQMLELFAVQAGLAIHHAQERERLREGVRLAELRRTVMDVTAHEVEVDRILDAVHEPLRVGMRADMVQARMIDPALPQVESRLGGETLPLTRAERDERVKQCWQRREVWLISSLAEPPDDPAEAEFHDRSLRSLQLLGAGSALVVPVGAGAETLAVVTLLRTDAWSAWTPAEIETMSEIGAEVGRSMLRARLHQQEQRLVTELQELDAYKGEMISTLTHELKNALMAIRGHVTLLREIDAPARSLDAISRNAGRLEKLTADLLLLSRVRDPQRGFSPELLDFSELVGSAVALHRDERPDLELSSAGVQQGVVLDGEGKDLEVMIHNLVGNALKYTHEGTVSVTLQDHGEDVVLTVADTGIGIDPRDLDSLFNEFDRSSNPQALAVPGSGLGLAIVRRIVERHGGRISVTSELSRGSTFEVRLPRSSSGRPPGVTSAVPSRRSSEAPLG